MTSNDDDGESPYVIALGKIERGEWPVSQVMASSPVCLLAAVAYGDFPNAVGLLLKHGANANVANATGQTPLHFAAGHDRLLVVRILLEANASPNAADVNGRTALHVSAQHRNARVTRALLEHGANVDFASKSGATPLKIAFATGDADVIEDMRMFRSEEEAEKVITQKQELRLTRRRDRRLARVKKMSTRAFGPAPSESDLFRRVKRSSDRIWREFHEGMRDNYLFREEKKALREAKKKRERETRECIVTYDDVTDDDVIDDDVGEE